MRGFQRVDVDQRIVVQNQRVMRADEPHAAHIGGQRVYLLDAARRLQAVLPAPQIQHLKLVGGGRRVFRILQVSAAHPVTSRLQIIHQVMADETAGTGHQNSRTHAFLLHNFISIP